MFNPDINYQICWYLAAVVQVQLCKYFIEIGDSERESTVWGEINVLRFAMLEYGNRSPIGSKLCPRLACHILTMFYLARQEKLLQGLMREIVRMTAQKQPLEVGVPLYPFSHAGVFDKGTRQGGSSDGERVPLPAPLPNSSPYTDPINSPGSMNGQPSPTLSGTIHSAPSVSRSNTAGWGVDDTSGVLYAG
jgi:hypothetical protein